MSIEITDTTVSTLGIFMSNDEKNKPVAIRLSDSLVELLKKEARKRAFELDKEVTWADVVREDMEQRYSSSQGTIEARLNQRRTQKKG